MFIKAITKKPCSRFSEGITTANLGKPDLQLALQQHRDYIEALKACGLEVIELDADERFPDSCFVEDVAVITDEAAVITNPGAESRRGEIHSMIPVLEKFRKLFFIESPGILEGGDVMQIDKHFYIGITQRTNEEGAHQLGKILSQFGYDYTLIPVSFALHLKSVVNYIGNNNLLASKEFVTHSAFSQNPADKNFNMMEVSDEELYAANCLLVNDKLIIPKGFDRVKSQLVKLGTDKPYPYHLMGTGGPYPDNIIELNMTEFEKMDGGLTCLSLRFS